MPKDDASMSDWAKFILLQIKESDEKRTQEYTTLTSTIESYKREHNEHMKSITKVNACVAKLIQENTHLKEQCTDLQEKMLKLEYHTRRNNLQFDGFEEEEGETDWDCYNKIRRVIANCYEDDIDPNEEDRVLVSAYEKAGEVTINRIHRYGVLIKGRRLPIIVNFQCFLDTDHILGKKKSMPEGIYVNEDFLHEIKQRRMALLPVLREAMRLPKYRGKARLKYYKLIVMGKEYTMPNLDELPSEIQLGASCQEENDDIIAFFGMHSVFSSFHKANFKVSGETFNCAEQYIQAAKAKSCDDDYSHHKIMSMKDPREMKHQGSRHRNFVPQKWECDKARETAHTAVKNKFQQNNLLAAKLKETAGKTIVEASREVPWGCGVGLKHPGVLTPAQWTNGLGLMSEILAQVRQELT